MAEVRLEPMSEEEYAEFRVRSELSYATAIVASPAMPLSEARRKAAEDHERLLSDGLRTDGHFLWTAYEGDQPVGDLWLHMEPHQDGLHAFGYWFEVRQECRQRGCGRAIAEAAEQKCREMNVVSIGLTVFGPTRRHRVCIRTWALRRPCSRYASAYQRHDEVAPHGAPGSSAVAPSIGHATR